MTKRDPIVAGQFYPADRGECIRAIEECLAERRLPRGLADTLVAGIVPHAGWVFSGALAAMVFAALKSSRAEVDTFMIFGAAHAYYGDKPAVYDSGCWRTPLGEIGIDDELASRLIESSAAVSEPRAHAGEHSIEVQVPFVQHLFPGARIVPVVMAPNRRAILLGEAVGEMVASCDKRIVCIGSSDLTHYGPRYNFTPMGTGPEACVWASEVNDNEFINFALKLEPEHMISSALEKASACGGGAAAAAAAAALKLGASGGVLLAHANSNEIMRRKMGTTSSESVGYAAIVF